MIRVIKTEKFEEIKNAVEKNDGYCPCIVQHTPESKCMCQSFKDQVKRGELGKCLCGMYEIIDADERTEKAPPRYCIGKYQCKDVLKELLEHKKLTGIQAFYYGCAFKYLWRLGEKDEETKEIDKAENYLDFLKDTYKAAEK